MKIDIKLSKRLNAAALLAQNTDGTMNSCVADIGTDHAFLPIKLVLDGCSRVIASDINEGPCAVARSNIVKYGLADKINVICSPGLDRIEEFAPDTILICGMGGELIANILAESAYPADSRCGLLLQPMTMQDTLRRYLCASGFRIERELVVHEDGKYYQLLFAVYDGVIRELTVCEYRLGRLNLARAELTLSQTDRSWLEFNLRNIKKRIEGRKKSADSSSDDQAEDMEVAAVIKSILRKHDIRDSQN